MVMSARGAAFGDLFNDGKIDVVLNNLDSSPTLLRNVNPDQHHWIEFRLIGGAGKPRDAVGAAVFVTTGKITQRGDVLSGGSFASSNDPRVHFGLGGATSIDSVDSSLAWRRTGRKNCCSGRGSHSYDRAGPRRHGRILSQVLTGKA